MNLNIRSMVTLLRSKLLPLNNCSKKCVRNCYTLKGNRNVLTLNELINIHVNSYSFHFNSKSVIKFSTTSILQKGKNKKKVVHVDLNLLDQYIDVNRMTSQLDGALEKYKVQIIKHLALRTTAGSIEDLPIKYENEEYRFQDLLEISRKPNLVVLNASAVPELIPDVLKTLLNCQMNLNPQQEGTTIYISIPKVTKEYRENLAKSAKQYFVKCQESIRNIRNEYVNALKKNKHVPEDIVYRGQESIDALQKNYVTEAEQILKTKQNEILGKS